MSFLIIGEGIHFLSLNTRGIISVFTNLGTFVSGDKTSEGVSERHGDLSLDGRPGGYLQRLAEGRSFHHTGLACLPAVVQPHSQRQHWAAAAAAPGRVPSRG